MINTCLRFIKNKKILTIGSYAVKIAEMGEIMKKFTLYLGLNDKDTKTQKIGTLEAYKICNNILLNYTEGATVFEAKCSSSRTRH